LIFKTNCRLDASEQLNIDVDIIGNNAELDYDVEGISEHFKIQHNFNRLNADCVLLSTYFDRIINFAGALTTIHPFLITVHKFKL
jgi:hypothetical protein